MISRKEIIAYAKRKYGVEPDYPWDRSPNFAILRHQKSRKWFCAIMDITEEKLGLKGNKVIDVLNLKCDPLMVGSLIGETGIYPAYHMNKEHWISISLNSTISKSRVIDLLDLSFDLTQR